MAGEDSRGTGDCPCGFMILANSRTRKVNMEGLVKRKNGGAIANVEESS